MQDLELIKEISRRGVENAKSDKTARRRGFTLVEITVASIIGAFIAVTAVGALRAVTSGREKLNCNVATAAELRFASQSLRQDLANLYRDKDSSKIRFVGAVDSSDYGAAGRLTFYMVNRIKARPKKVEGDVYEVEYFLLRQDEESVLMRRLWPNPDREETPGGVVTMVAEGIVGFNIRYYDGESWLDEWPEEQWQRSPEDRSGGQAVNLPQLIKVDLAARLPQQRLVLTESFFVSLPRWPGQNVTGSAIDLLNNASEE